MDPAPATSRTIRPALEAVVLLFGTLNLCFPSASFAQVEPEDPGPLSTAQFLPPEVLSGDQWEVAPTVTSDGLSLRYEINSRFGSWQATSRRQVDQRIREIVALEQLDEISRTKVFQDAVRNAVVAPLNLIQDFASRPLGTLKAVPVSVGRWFRKTKFEVQERYVEARQTVDSLRADDDADAVEGTEADTEPKRTTSDRARRVGSKVASQARRTLGITSAERTWYRRLSVDPATDNEILHDAIRKVARVEGLTGFAVKSVGLPEIPGTSELGDVMDLVWSTDSWELRRRNRKELIAFGLDAPSARSFEENRAFPLSLQTELIMAVRRLDGVDDRALLIERAVSIEDRGAAEMLVGAVSLLADLHRSESPLDRIVEGTRVPAAQTGDGVLVGTTAREALFWTEEVARGAAVFGAAHRDPETSARVLWLRGRASDRFRDGMAALGWSLQTLSRQSDATRD